MSRRRALITGGARRIGALFARALSREGWNVVISHSNSPEQATDLVNELKQSGSADAGQIQADLRRPDQANKLMERCLSEFGDVHLLINNAALFNNDVLINSPEVSKKIPAVSLENWQEHHNVNGLAPVLLSQAFAQQGSTDTGEQWLGHQPSIVHIIDQRVMRPNPLFFSYLAAKSMLQSLTVTMAQALAPAIRVNAIAPGPIYPSPRQSAENFERQGLNTLLQREVDPNDLTSCLMFLLNTQSITGQTIAIDNGQHLAWKTPDVVRPSK